MVSRQIPAWFVRQAGWIGLAVVVVAGLAYWQFSGSSHGPSATHSPHDQAAVEVTPASHSAEPVLVDMPRESWGAAGIEVQPVAHETFAETIALTGKIALNQDRVSHIFPLVAGRVDEVHVKFGQQVKAGDLLVVVQSQEIGQAKLQLFQDRQQHEFATTKDKWTQDISANTLAMIELMRGQASIEKIEASLRGRPLGDARDKLMSAYVAHYRAQREFDRLTPLTRDGAVPGKQLLEAESARNASRATLQSLLEQLEQETRQQAAASQQSVKELSTRIAVDETTLEVLGFTSKDLTEINPVRQGESISHYYVRAPFAGTVISKDVTQLERVSPESPILTIADLSTVWITADIFEEHLPSLQGLQGKPIVLRSSAWPGEQFSATVFYTGDIVDESTRTVSLRASAENAAGKLKPGLFVTVEMAKNSASPVVQVPADSLQEHEGQTFVFVQHNEQQFERRNVVVGRRNARMVEIVSGVRPGEPIAVAGCFALKSQLLAELLAE
jgi:cobalt-zinc-cadmium efflux system membrane fusion protein